MDLIIAVVLGAILFGKCSSDRRGAKASQRDFDARRQITSSWRSKVTDLKLEYELRLFIGRPENRYRVKREVQDVYDKIFSMGIPFDILVPRCNWIKKNKNWSYSYHEEVQRLASVYNRDNALRIMMAKRGKICDQDAYESSLWFGATDGVSPLGLSTLPHTIHTCCQLDAYVLIWCADELKKHGITDKFVHGPINPYGCGGMHWEISCT